MKIKEAWVSPSYTQSQRQQEIWVARINYIGCVLVGGWFFSGDYAPTYVYLINEEKHREQLEKLSSETENAAVRFYEQNEMWTHPAYKNIADESQKKLARDKYYKATLTLQKQLKVDDFLKEVVEVCKKHGLSIGHEDIHGAFTVEKYSEDLKKWLLAAHDDQGEHG